MGLFTSFRKRSHYKNVYTEGGKVLITVRVVDRGIINQLYTNTTLVVE